MHYLYCPYKNWRGHRHLQRRRRCRDGGRDGVRHLQAEECQKPTEARKGPLLELHEGARPCRHLDFRLLSSRTAREWISLVLSHLVCANLLWKHSKINTRCINLKKKLYSLRQALRVKGWVYFCLAQCIRCLSQCLAQSRCSVNKSSFN